MSVAIVFTGDSFRVLYAGVVFDCACDRLTADGRLDFFLGGRGERKKSLQIDHLILGEGI